ncbi:MAG: hypothetical protein SGPRY_015025, partial [Prymnesium sp.]
AAIRSLVLRTWVAARPSLARSAREGLSKLGVQRDEDYGLTFELAAFDLLVDSTLSPWLVEINTTPSLKLDKSGEDRGIKRGMLSDLLHLVDAVPDATPPPELALLSLMRENTLQLPDSCKRRWKLSDCHSCPSWADVYHLVRGSAERRRRGGFEPLSPSLDDEWLNLMRSASLAEKNAPSHDELELAWLQAPGTGSFVCEHSVDESEACIQAKWSSILC